MTTHPAHPTEAKTQNVEVFVTELVETLSKDHVDDSVVSLDPVPAKITISNVFQHPNAHPLLLDLLLLKKFSTEWIAWDPDTFHYVLPKAFGGAEPSALAVHKMCALQTLHLVDSYWHRWEVFLPVTMSLNGIDPNFEVLQVPTVCQVAASVDIASFIRKDVSWSDELKAFVGAVVKHDHFYQAPEILSFCKLQSEPLEADLISRVEKAYKDIKVKNKTDEVNEVVEQQAQLLVMVDNYVFGYRKRLKEQLHLLKS